MPDINKILKQMRESGKIMDHKGKGSAGEKAVLEVAHEFLRSTGGIMYLSYKYPYQSDRSGACYLGNIKYENGKFVDYSSTSYNDEVDVLLITPYRIYPIEVKSYHAKIELYDFWMRKNKEEVDKSTIVQTEKHARHFYHFLNPFIPEGNPDYIVPIACFVDRCEISDNRSTLQQEYVKVAILNTLMQTLIKTHTPLDNCLDIQAIYEYMDKKKVSFERRFKV